PIAFVAHRRSVERRIVLVIDVHHSREVARLKRRYRIAPAGRDIAAIDKHQVSDVALPTKAAVEGQAHREEKRQVKAVGLHGRNGAREELRSEAAVAVSGGRKYVADAPHLQERATNADALAEHLQGADHRSAMRRHEAQIVTESAIVVKIAGEESTVAEPMR